MQLTTDLSLRVCSGNYGVPSDEKDEFGLPKYFESDRIQITALIIADYSANHSHYEAVRSLGDWLKVSLSPLCLSHTTLLSFFLNSTLSVSFLPVSVFFLPSQHLSAREGSCCIVHASLWMTQSCNLKDRFVS